MKQFLARLNPMERRFVVGVIVVFFIVINIVWVLPHFGDWGKTKIALANTRKTNDVFQSEINKLPSLQDELKKYQREGQSDVPAEDQAVQFFRIIQNQAAQSGVIIQSMPTQRQSSGTNDPFYVEQNQTITLLAGEKQLVDFLYNLGAGNSLVRVRVLSVQPEQSRQQLTARVTLVASYQRKSPLAAAAAGKPGATAPKATTPAAPKPTTPAPKPATPAPKPTTPAPALPPVPKLPPPSGIPAPTNAKPLTPIKK